MLKEHNLLSSHYSSSQLTLIVPTVTKVVCFCRLLKCLEASTTNSVGQDQAAPIGSSGSSLSAKYLNTCTSIRGSRRSCQRGSNFDKFLVDDGREDPNTTNSGPSSARQRNAI